MWATTALYKQTPRLLALWLLAICTAHATDCRPTQRLQLESASYFKNIHGKSIDDHSDEWSSTFMLPAANECQIESIAPKSASYRCTWYMEKGLESENPTREAFNSLVTSLADCVAKPNTLERDKKHMEHGERVRFDDPYPNMPQKYYRGVNVTYDYEDARWVITWVYEIEEDESN